MQESGSESEQLPSGRVSPSKGSLGFFGKMAVAASARLNKSRRSIDSLAHSPQSGNLGADARLSNSQMHGVDGNLEFGGLVGQPAGPSPRPSN